MSFEQSAEKIYSSRLIKIRMQLKAHSSKLIAKKYNHENISP